MTGSSRHQHERAPLARPRFAYLITSHKLPGQVVRLTSLLRDGSPRAWIVIHHDDRTSRLDPAKLEALGAHLLEPPSVVEWGAFSHLLMLIRSLTWLLRNTDFDWLVLLSGQDYPIRSIAEIEQSVATAAVDGFIETHPCARPRLSLTDDEFAIRYHYRWSPVPAGLAGPLARVATKARPFVRVRNMPTATWIGVPALRSPFGPHLVCHSGSDWFTLSRTAVRSIDRAVDERPDLVRYYRRTPSPAESFFQTVLANDSALRLSGDHRRYVVFESPRASHPRVLRMGDLDAVLASGCDFARKFDETVDAAVLDEIDRRVHSNAGGGGRRASKQQIVPLDESTARE